MPRSNSLCASGLHDVSKWTRPSFASSTCPSVGGASTRPVVSRMAIAGDVFIALLLRSVSGTAPFGCRLAPPRDAPAKLAAGHQQVIGEIWDFHGRAVLGFSPE